MIKKRMWTFLLLMPQLFVIGLLLFGVFSGMVQSFGIIPVLDLTRPTLKYYMEVLSNPETVSSLLFSLWVSFASATLSVTAGILVCYIFSLQNPLPKWIERVIRIPIIIPHVIVALFVIQLFSQTGLLPRLFNTVGVEQAQNWFSRFLFDPQGKGIILGYLWKEVPFIIFFCYALIRQINTNLGEVAQTLGATKWQSYMQVTLPLCRDTIAAGYLIIFSFSLGAYELPRLLGPVQPKALPVLAYEEYIHPSLQNRPYAMAINGLIFITGLICALAYFYLVFRPLDSRRRGNRK